MRRIGGFSEMVQRGLCLYRATRNPVLNKSVPFSLHPAGAERSGGFAVQVEGGDFEKSNFSNHVRGMG